MRNAVIIESRPPWSMGRRAGALGALLAAVVLAWWLAAGESVPRAAHTEAPAASSAGDGVPTQALRPALQASPGAVATPPPTAMPPAVMARAPASVAALSPYRYVGQWRAGRRTTVVLGSTQGVSFVVRVPGSVDERYEVEAIDEHRVLLRDRLLGRAVALPLSGDPAKAAAEPARADERAAAADASPVAASIATPAPPVVLPSGPGTGEAAADN